MATVLTGGHCVCCFHDYVGICLKTYANCKPNKEIPDPTNPSDKITIPVNQNTGPYKGQKSDNSVYVVVGTKDRTDVQIYIDNSFPSIDAYAMTSKAQNSQVIHRINGHYDVGLIRFRIAILDYMRRKLEYLRLPLMYANR